VSIGYDFIFTFSAEVYADPKEEHEPSAQPPFAAAPDELIRPPTENVIET